MKFKWAKVYKCLEQYFAHSTYYEMLTIIIELPRLVIASGLHKTFDNIKIIVI